MPCRRINLGCEISEILAPPEDWCLVSSNIIGSATLSPTTFGTNCTFCDNDEARNVDANDHLTGRKRLICGRRIVV
jgi:hypothetical protein